MSKLAITSFVFSAQANKVVLANSNTAKVALGASGTLCVAQSDDPTTRWSLLQAPSWVALSTSQDNKTATITFNLTNQQITQPEPFNFIVVATAGDGTSEDMRAISVVVKEPLEIREVTANLTSMTLLGYDDSVPTVKFKAFTGDAAATNVRYIPPSLAALPGLRFLLDGDDASYLEVVPRTQADPSGGVKRGAGTEKITIRAYKAESIYDSFENAATLEFTLNFTGEKAGVLSANLVAAFDASTDINPTTGYGAVVVECPTTFVGGKAQNVAYDWRTTGTATGRFLTGGTASTNKATWEVQGDGTIGFSVDIKNGSTILKTLTVDPIPVSAKNPTAPAAQNWTTSDAIPVILLPQDLQVKQPIGNRAYIRFELPDLLVTETATIQISIDPVGAAPAVVDARVSNGTLAIPITDPIQVVGSQSKLRYLYFEIPATANAFDAWTVSIGATSNVNARTGHSFCSVVCTGLPAIYRVDSVPSYSDVSRLSGSVGSQISPVPIRAYAAVQADLPSNPPLDFFLSEVNQSNSTLVSLPEADITLFVDVQGSDTTDYPVGVYPNVQGTLEGPFHRAGDFYLYTLAKRAGFSSQRSLPIPIRVLPGVAPMVFTSFSSNYTVVTASTTFPLAWGYSGAGDIYIQKNNDPRKRVNPGELSMSFTGLNAHAIFTLSGVNSMGTTFAVPVLVKFSGTGVVSKLPSSPTVAIIDAQNNLEVTWMPSAIGGVFSVYKSWDITLFDALFNSIKLVKADGTPITGFENADPNTPDVRRFRVAGVQAGPLSMNMQAFSTNADTIQDSDTWDTNKLFPTLPPTAVTINGLDSTTALKGESVTIAIGNGIIADKWRVVFADQSSTDWLPISTTSLLKSFMVGGETQIITVEVEEDYSTSLPPVKLRRSVQKSLFIVDEDFIPVEGSDPVLGNIGVGGDAGFEVTDGTAAGYEPANYAVFTKAVVKDETTQELKLMLGVARGRDASSVLGTMALDVFPLPGRPYAKDLVRPISDYLADDGFNTAPVKITTDGLPPVTVGHSLTWTKAGGPGSGEIKIQAIGGRRPYTWAADNLPPGVRFTADGTLSGTVLAPGTYPIDFSVSDSSNPAYIDKKTLPLLARSDLAIITPFLPGTVVPSTQITTMKVGDYYSGQLEAEGGVKTYSWKQVSGSLPLGLSIDTTGKITGWPCTANSTSDFATDFVVVMQVTDSLGAKASKQYTVRLLPQDLQVGDPDQLLLFSGQRFLVRVPVSGGDFSVDATTGVSTHNLTVNSGGLFEANPVIVNGWIELKFDPAFAPTNNAPVKITVADGKTQVTRDFVFTVRPRLAAFTPFLEAGFGTTFNTNSQQTATLTGLSGAYSVKDDAPLPAYLNGLVGDIVPTLGGAGFKVSGTPTTSRTVEVSASATLLKSGASMGRISRVYSLIAQIGAMSAASPATFQVTSLPMVVGGPAFLDPMRSYFNAVSTRRGGLSAKLKQGYPLPTGMSFDARNGMFYGILRGTDITSTIVEFLDVQGNTVATSEVTFDVYTSDLTLSNILPTLVKQGKYLLPLNINGTSSPAVSIARGGFPEGFGVAVAGNVATFSGRPIEAGYFDLWLRLSDTTNAGRVGLFYQRLEVAFNEPLQILTTDPPSITLGQAYSFQLQATGGIPFSSGTAYKWAITGATQLPTPYTLSESGLISGTSNPSTPSTWSGSIQVKVTDASDDTKTATLAMSITQLPPLVITTTSLPSGVALSPYANNVYLQATGGLQPNTEWSVAPDTNTPANLPAGMTLDATTGLLSGTPQVPFNGQLRFSVKDSANPKNQSFKLITLTVVPIDSLHIESVTPVKVGVANALPDAFVGVTYGPVEVYVKGGIKPYANPRLLGVYTTTGTETPFQPSVGLEIVPKPGTDDRFLIRSKTGTTPTAAFSAPVWIVVDDVHSVEPLASRPYPPANAAYDLYVDRYAPQGTITSSPATVKQGETLTIAGNYAIGGGTDTVRATLTVTRKDNGATLRPSEDLTPSTSTTPTTFSRDLATATIPANTVVVSTLTLTNASGKVVTKTAESTISAITVSLTATPATISNDGLTFGSTSLVGDWSTGNFTAKLFDNTNPGAPVQISGSVSRQVGVAHSPHSTTPYILRVYDINNVEVASATCQVVVTFAAITAALTPASQSVLAGASFTVLPTFQGGVGRIKALYGATTLFDNTVTSGANTTIPTTGVPQNGVIDITLTVTNNATPPTVLTKSAQATVSAASASLSASPNPIVRGNSTTLSYSWSGGNSAKLLKLTSGVWVDFQTGVPATGSKVDSPTVDTSYRLEVYDAGGTALNHSDATVTVTIPPDPDPIIDTTSLAQMTYGTYGTTSWAGHSGVAPLVWTLLSPASSVLQGYGLNFSNGTISGTPNSSCPSSIPITVKLSDASSSNNDAQKTLSLAVVCGLNFGFPGTISLQNGVPYNLNNLVTGGTVQNWTMTPTPSGVTLTTAGILTANVASLNQSGTITGTGPCPGISRMVILSVVANPVLCSWNTNAINVAPGGAVSITASASGGAGGSYTFAVADNGPAWPSFLSSPSGSGTSKTVTGTAPTQPGVYRARVMASDATGTGYTVDCVITVTAPTFDFAPALGGSSLGTIYGSVTNPGGLNSGSYATQGNAFKITATNAPSDAQMRVVTQPASYMGVFSVVKLSANTFEVRATQSSLSEYDGLSSYDITLELYGTGGSVTKTLTLGGVGDYNSLWTPFILKCLLENGQSTSLPTM